ncbi:MAG: insulinase family protein [Pyrinomonadaceae bacterium]|nr:insulinase family protein [Pyrinomonadaceae bacterium]
MQLRQTDKTALSSCQVGDEIGSRKLWRTLTRVGTLGLALLVSLTLTAAQEKALPAAPGTAKAAVGERAVTPVDPVSLVTEFDVNGLKVLIKRRTGTQTVVAGLFIKGGVRNTTPDKGGVESLMLDTASEATVSFPRERLRTELSRMGTTIGSGVNYDYSGLTMASTRANFDRSWEIFTDVALKPSFTVDDVERVRNRMVASLRDDNDTPDSYLQVLQARVAYAGHPYLNDPRGNAESVARLTSADLRQYHKQVMETSRLLLVVVGDLDPQMLRNRIAASFGRLPRGNYNPGPLPELSFTAPSVQVTERSLPTNYVQGVFTAPNMAAPDIYAMRVASTILQNRVFIEVRHKRNLSYAPDAFLWSQGANLGGIYVTAVDANQSVHVMLDEITRLQREPLPQEELESTVQHFLTRHYLGQETNAAQAGELAQYEIIGGGWRNAFVFLPRLRAVTAADVQRVAQKYMRNLRFVVLGDPKSVDTKLFLGG